MAKSTYRGLKSSVRKVQSAAKRMFTERLKMPSLSARAKAKPLVNSVKENKGKTKHKNVVQVLPMKPIGTLVQQLPVTDLTIKGMSLKALLRKTPKLMKYNSHYVVVKKMGKKKTKTGLPAIQGQCFSEDGVGASRTIYDLYVIGLDSKDKPVSQQKRVLVSCNCQNYTYTWEYANAYHGCSKIIYGNGEAPNFTNPGYMPGMCKHLCAFTDEIIKKGL